jgi:hypothetical protein
MLRGAVSNRMKVFNVRQLRAAIENYPDESVLFFTAVDETGIGLSLLADVEETVIEEGVVCIKLTHPNLRGLLQIWSLRSCTD